MEEKKTGDEARMFEPAEPAEPAPPAEPAKPYDPDESPGAQSAPATPFEPTAPFMPTEPVAQPATAQPTVPQSAPAAQPAVAQPVVPQSVPAAQPASDPAAPAAQPVGGSAPAQPAAPQGEPAASVPVPPPNPYAAAQAAQAAPAQPQNPYAPQDPAGGSSVYGSVPPVSAMPPQSNGKAIGALVCGILAIVFSGTVVLGLILGVVAIVLSGSYIRQFGRDGKAFGGKVCGIIGIVLSIISFAIIVASCTLALTAIEEGDLSVDDSGATYSYGESATADDQADATDAGAEDGATDTTLAADEQAAASAASGALKNIASNKALLETLAINAETYFSDETDGVSLADTGVTGEDLVKWMAESITCAPDEDGVFVEDDGTATVFLDGSCYTMGGYLEAVENVLANQQETDNRESAVTFAATEALSTTEPTEFYAMVDLTYESGAWTVLPESLEENAEYMFDLWS
ncbi:DUF4190 domain-containing protein [Xiamenia xianingshaonis]|uniref:DUF4190 domain-containing protein n=1 Tax=Xiamenia xianingshaonis TaxID=2682776 RepID=A0A9E6MRH0_9ACTN|nr:DUF4190 domain-containing protein [Xiamenia xianingshaonis]NHM14542.1 hypothetical protein [Xiamenia xianingshaonis]QTU85007.1 DUF4190 domain-containing protein [Xiamenia xianingshaonis]